MIQIEYNVQKYLTKLKSVEKCVKMSKNVQKSLKRIKRVKNCC